MAEGGGMSKAIDFVPMKTIGKIPDDWDDRCTDWVATEKVHGSSFQFYTDDGLTVHTGSRRRNLDTEQSFLKCNIQDFLSEYKDFVIKFWHAISSNDKWNRHRDIIQHFEDEDQDGHQAPEDKIENTNGLMSENTKDIDKNDDDKIKIDEAEYDNEKPDPNQCGQIMTILKSNNNSDNKFQLRIYGELYGGGGVHNDNTKQQIQKEIIYCDNFRFYVFGATINRKWLTVSELGALCRDAGFPYFARPVNGVPMKTVGVLKQWLDDNGLMRSKSTLTERKDDKKTFVEGFVLTPLTKPDFRLHAIKYLAPSFNDVRTEQRTNHKTKTVYCTKQRYHSVISKLNDDERRDTELVLGMMVDDIISESGEAEPSKNQQKTWRKMTTGWLKEDGYWSLEEVLIRRREEEGVREDIDDEWELGDGEKREKEY